MSAAFTFCDVAAVALVRPSWPLALAVYAALVVGFAFDSADGQLARLTGKGGPAGECLDHVVDCANMVALHAAVLIAFHRFLELPGDGRLLLPLSFQPAAAVTFCGGLLTEQLKRGRPTQDDAGSTPAARPSRLRAVALLPVARAVSIGGSAAWVRSAGRSPVPRPTPTCRHPACAAPPATRRRHEPHPSLVSPPDGVPK